MGLGFDNIPEKKGYLRQAGLHQDARFVGLIYTANEAWEGFDIEFETADGKLFRERTFGADINKVYPRTKWENGKQIGTETKQEAFDRTQEEISRKLFDLASCFVRKDVLKEKVRSASTLKELVDKVNGAIGSYDSLPRVNFLTIWKNSDSRKKSNLIIADKVKWCEPAQFDANSRVLPATIKLNNYQAANCVIEKYPYQSSESVSSTDTVVGGGTSDDLPF